MWNWNLDFGIDLSPIFPTEGFPLNVEFIQYNVLDVLPYEDSSFDFVHEKFMVSAFTEEQWKKNVIPEIIRLTRPDGWVELLERDTFIISDGNATTRIAKAFKDFMRSRGMNSIIGKKGGKTGQERIGQYEYNAEHFDALIETISIEAEKTTSYFNQYLICGHKKI
ncbi:4419_t:CDS:2 [Ambispora gerdemannii]|uniref:4419_t:CDS:1 n=1 Tax=Ambispora gerdemannii TaxID=144530 RepID=A0A9N8UZZ8_9GLOM|nr:4419_t:CDS:2 [Ambispora gerdemannii]